MLKFDMKKAFLIILAVFFGHFSLFSQILNGYKYVSVPELSYKNDANDIYGVAHDLKIYFGTKGLIVLSEERKDWPADAQLDPCLVLYFKYIFTEPPSTVGFTIINCKNEILFDEKSKSSTYGKSLKTCWKNIYIISIRIIYRDTFKIC